MEGNKVRKTTNRKFEILRASRSKLNNSFIDDYFNSQNPGLSHKRLNNSDKNAFNLMIKKQRVVKILMWK